MLKHTIIIYFPFTDQDRLFYVIYEKVSVAPEAFLPHLWTYRSRITLEHLYQILQTQKDTYPILYEFLQQVNTQIFITSLHGNLGTSLASYTVSTWYYKTTTTNV